MQAGHPLNNLLNGTLGGSPLVGPQFRAPTGAYSTGVVAPKKAAFNVGRTLPATLGRIGAATFRAANPLGTTVLNTGLGLGAAALFGPVKYEPGKDYLAGKVSDSGKSFKLNEPILDAKGKPQSRAPIVGGSLDLKAFSQGEVSIAITGINDADKAFARKAYALKYGYVPKVGTESGLVFHHGPQTGTVVENGVALPVARMQLVPMTVNNTFPHQGTAAVAKRELTAQGVSNKDARIAARMYNKSALDSVRTKGSAPAMGALNVYLVSRDILQGTGLLNPDYVPSDFMEYVFEDSSASFTVQPAGWFSSATKTYVNGGRIGQVEKIDTSTVDSYRESAEAKYGRYLPGNLIWNPTFKAGTDRTRIDYVDSNGFTRGYIDAEGPHLYSPREAFKRSGI